MLYYSVPECGGVKYKKTNSKNYFGIPQNKQIRGLTQRKKPLSVF